MTTLDTKETLATLHRVNAAAKVRRLTINKIVNESRNASSLEALRQMIEQFAEECEQYERNCISK